MSSGRVHSWDLSTGVDGPGTRCVVFLAGCPLRCLYCQNPDTWHMRDGTGTTAAQLLATIEGFASFLRTAGGGLTVSGGEPLLQPAFTRALFTGARDLGLHTALDTSGALGARADDRLLDATSLVLLDIKCWDPAGYRRLTGGQLQPTLDFARRLASRGTPVWLRYVLVPGHNDHLADVEALAGFTAGLGNVERVDVLPLHKLGMPKYDRLGIAFPLRDTPTPDAGLTERIRGVFRGHGLRTS
ncbi:pyruvate formate-lyase-activating protein [Dactylosporangium sp. CA-052675]|uniref:pyruvate formate-lyase-activating protein n=1 Tax=Dactylosporangium sp. CA-052675 TaxID=3239927 RepID=UPI003D900696